METFLVIAGFLFAVTGRLDMSAALFAGAAWWAADDARQEVVSLRKRLLEDRALSGDTSSAPAGSPPFTPRAGNF